MASPAEVRGPSARPPTKPVRRRRRSSSSRAMASFTAALARVIMPGQQSSDLEDDQDRVPQLHSMTTNANRRTNSRRSRTSMNFFKQSQDEEDESGEEPEPQIVPPASVLCRRQALVPPKLLCDYYSIDRDETPTSAAGCSADGSDMTMRSLDNRRSSVPTLPALPLHPGDSSIYVQGLVQRSSCTDLASLDPGSNICSIEESPKKSRNTFSFKMFSKNKSGSRSSGLEEVLNSMPRSSFSDKELSKYKAISWDKFLTMVCDRSPSSDVVMTNVDSSGIVSSNNSPSPTSRSPSPQSCRKAGGQPDSANSRQEGKRKEAFWNLFQSQCVFLYDYLMVLKNVYMEPLKQTQVEGHTMFVEPDVLFGNLDELCCVLYAFCKEYIKFVLHDLQGRGDVRITLVLVKLFEKSALATSLLQAFYKYTLNYSSARNYLDELRRNSEFIELEKWCQRDPRCKKLQLTDLLVAPVQHTMKILIILKDLEMCTTNASEKKIIGDIVAAQEGWLHELNDKMI